MDNRSSDQPGEEESQLKQRIKELEQRVADLEAELKRKPFLERSPVNWRLILKPLFLLLLTLGLAILPAFLVFQDRWAGSQAAAHALQNFWCRDSYLCNSAFPAYFGVIFPALICLVFLVTLQKTGDLVRLPEAGEAQPPATISSTQRRVGWFCLWGGAAFLGIFILEAWMANKPADGRYGLAYLVFLAGWYLLEVPWARTLLAWRRQWKGAVGAGLVLVCLVVLIASLYGGSEFQWITVGLLGLGLAAAWALKPRVAPIAWVAALALILYSLNLNAWWTSAIGDEYSFFVQARNILQEGGLAKVSEQFFWGGVVNGTHPYFSSLIQALFMSLLGINGFAWRFSNVALSAAAVVFFYAFFRLLVPRRTALLGAVFLAASHYVMSFGRIGYNNLQALFGMSLALAASAWAVRSGRRLAYTLLGAAMGVCFYLYPAALYILPLPILVLLFFQPPRSRLSWQNWALMLVAMGLLIAPLFFQPDYWKTKVFGTFYNNPELVATWQAFVTHLVKNFFYAFFSFLFITSEGHFVAASYLDPLVGALACLGLAYLVGQSWRKREAGFLVVSLVLLVFLVGASHDREFPPNTRMFLLLPWWMLLGAIGFAWLWEGVQKLGLVRSGSMIILAAVIMVMIGLNLYQANVVDRDRMAGLQNLENLFLRILQTAQKEELRFPKSYYFITDRNWSSEGIRLITQTYPVRGHIQDVVVEGEELPEAIRALIARQGSLVIIKPWLDPQLKLQYEAALAGLGKMPCDITATNGDLRFVLWHSPEAASLCR